AEQKKHRKSPGRNAEQAIDQPADAGTDQDACNEFAGEAKAPGVARCSRRLLRTSAVRRIAAGMARLAESFIEPLESRGESGLVGLRLAPVAVVACVAHAIDTRGLQRSRLAHNLKAARTILTGFRWVQKPPICFSLLKYRRNTRRAWCVWAALCAPQSRVRFASAVQPRHSDPNIG